MPSVHATALPHSSVDGCAPTARTWLGRQARRVLVLAGLVVGFWLLGSIVHGAHASAAPIHGTSATRTSGTNGPLTLDPIRSVGSVEGTVTMVVDRTRAAQPIRQLAAELPTTVRGAMRTLIETVPAATHALATITQLPSSAVVQIVSPSARVVLSAAGSAARSGAAATPAALSAPVATTVPPVTASNATAAERSSTLRPTGRQALSPAPAQAPAPAGCLLGAGGLGASQASGGAAAALPAATHAPTRVLASAPRSHNSAILRTATDRLSVSPD